MGELLLWAWCAVAVAYCAYQLVRWLLRRRRSSTLVRTGAATTVVILAAVVRVSSMIATLAVPIVEVGAETAVEETSARKA